MKRTNFPRNKLLKQMKAAGEDPNDPANEVRLEEARRIRTKKDRS